MQYSFTGSVISCLKDKVRCLSVREDADSRIDIIELQISTCELSHDKCDKFYGAIEINSNDGKIMISIPYSDGKSEFCNRISMSILNERNRLVLLHMNSSLSLKDLSFTDKLLKSKITYELSDDVAYFKKQIDLSKQINDLPKDMICDQIYFEFQNLYNDSKAIILKLIEKM